MKTMVEAGGTVSETTMQTGCAVSKTTVKTIVKTCCAVSEPAVKTMIKAGCAVSKPRVKTSQAAVYTSVSAVQTCNSHAEATVKRRNTTGEKWTTSIRAMHTVDADSVPEGHGTVYAVGVASSDTARQTQRHWVHTATTIDVTHCRAVFPDDAVQRVLSVAHGSAY